MHDVARKRGERHESSERVACAVSHYHLHRHGLADRATYPEYDRRHYAASRGGQQDLPHRLVFGAAEAERALVVLHGHGFETVSRDGRYRRQYHDGKNERAGEKSEARVVGVEYIHQERH